MHLQQIFLSPLSLAGYAMVLSPFVRIFVLTGDSLPLLVASVMIIFAWHVIHLFTHDVLLSDERPLPPVINLAHTFSSDLVRALSKEPKLTTYSLLRAAVSSERGKFILGEIGISRSDFLARFETEISKQIDVFGFLHRALDLSAQLGESRVGPSVLLYFFFQHGGPFTDLLNEQDLSLNDFAKLIEWEKKHNDWKTEHRKWKPEKLIRFLGSWGRGWVMGYTSDLDKYTEDLAAGLVAGADMNVPIHKKEIESVLHVIERTAQRNVLLLGREGVGKRSLVKNIAAHVRMTEMEKHLSYTRILQLNSEMLISASKKPEQLFLKALEQAKKSGKFLFVVDNLSVLLGAGNENLVNVFMRFLREPNIALIAIVDSGSYHSLVKQHPVLGSMFETVFVNDADDDETMSVMMTHYFRLEEKKHLAITYKALKSVLQLSKRYIGSIGFPGKAVSVLNDAAQTAVRRGDEYVTETDVREMVSLKAHMDVRTVGRDEKDRLIRLEEALRSKVIGQDAALHALSNTLKRARLDIHEGKKPLGTFLFLGTTGVGKTETAKALAEEYFGSADDMIRLDMNEFSTESSVGQIIGSSASEGQKEGFLARRVQEKPFSLILLDEIEKAHPKVLNVFLQILDEGRLTDSVGITTDFRNTIIIATSNAGAMLIRDFVRDKLAMPPEEFKKKLIDTILSQNTFSPEFINRFDDIILYEPLSQENARKVAILMLDSIIEEMQDKKGISLRLEEEVIQLIVEKGYSQEFGAREMRRVITNTIENFIADHLLTHDVKRGESIVVRREDAQRAF